MDLPALEVSRLRLYILRAMYLFIAAGLGVFLWPDLLSTIRHPAPGQGYEASCMLAAFSLLCVVGLRYPLQMLPVLIWETLWKTLWYLLVALPQWRSGHIDAHVQEQLFPIGMVLLVYLAVPWGYVYRRYVKARGERWS